MQGKNVSLFQKICCNTWQLSVQGRTQKQVREGACLSHPEGRGHVDGLRPAACGSGGQASGRWQGQMEMSPKVQTSPTQGLDQLLTQPRTDQSLKTFPLSVIGPYVSSACTSIDAIVQMIIYTFRDRERFLKLWVFWRSFVQQQKSDWFSLQYFCGSSTLSALSMTSPKTHGSTFQLRFLSPIEEWTKYIHHPLKTMLSPPLLLPLFT